MSHVHSRPRRRRARYLAAMALVTLLILGNLMLIFHLSSESREESGSRSRELTLVVLRVLYPHLDSLPEAEQDSLLDSFHGIVRKTAHFLEFALLGCLSAILVWLIRTYLDLSLRGLLTAGAPSLFCLLTAIADETYQIFTNRGASVKDVCIDFCGAVSGVLFLHVILWIGTAVGRRRALRTSDRKEGVSP